MMATMEQPAPVRSMVMSAFSWAADNAEASSAAGGWKADSIYALMLEN
jgi:hypothetical protein